MRVVLTGGPHSGKSTLIQMAKLNGVPVVPEGAIQVIDELVSQYGLDGASQWRRRNPVEFQRQIQARQVMLERSIVSDGLILHDRGVVDPVAYLHYKSIEVPQDMLALCRERRYQKVFVCEIVTPFRSRTGTGRTSDLSQAREVESVLEETYREFGYRPMRLAVCAPIMRFEALMSYCMTPRR